MTEMLVRAPLFDAPPVTRLKGTLLDVATIHEGMKWIGVTDVWPTYNCLDMKAIPGFCYVGGGTADKTAKDFSGAPNWVDGGTPFGVYGGVTCRPFGFDGMDAIRPAFEAREHVGVEQGVMTILAASSPVILAPKTGGVDVGVSLGIAALEEHAACHYAGAPTLHLPRGVASLASVGNALVAEGNTLVTKLGSKVAAGGGYGCPNKQPTGQAAPGADEKWLYATGEVVLWRGEVQDQEVFNQATNDVTALVERTYMVAFDCYIAAVKVKVA